jgi:hypothetical protein
MTMVNRPVNSINIGLWMSLDNVEDQIYCGEHSGLASGCRIFKNSDFLVDIGSFNIQTNQNKTEKSFSNLAVSQFCYSRYNKSTTLQV